jgi:two-component system, NarL family, sensor kinase
VVQECLTNIHRHSGSRVATIRILRDKDQVKLAVQDCGKGLPLGRDGLHAHRKLGVGIQGMRERIMQFGGCFEVRSGKNGTAIVATVPVPNPPVPPAAKTAS